MRGALLTSKHQPTSNLPHHKMIKQEGETRHSYSFCHTFYIATYRKSTFSKVHHSTEWNTTENHGNC
ncbi:hypothetical protein FRX31_032709 [Thalictrum thalictroides]|uniref:Uncharacterized protein n=1 Tax=Thalictrum thalictroides TaxID=46969 RepID=A0A7J6UYK4_THATH|nr:hypothetical protein FRX31_032709 [Thalictrum thalictroides]